MLLTHNKFLSPPLKIKSNFNLILMVSSKGSQFQNRNDANVLKEIEQEGKPNTWLQHSQRHKPIRMTAKLNKMIQRLRLNNIKGKQFTNIDKYQNP